MKGIKRLGLTIALTVVLAIGAAMTNIAPAAAQEPACRFAFGFQTLHDLIPATVGDCVENESHNNVAGDGLQRTTRGLLVWRKANNFTAFTDGARTWVNGPRGLQERSNNERFTWEGLERLKNAEYTLPIGDIRAEKNLTFTMKDGRWDYNNPPARGNAMLVQDQVGVGDFSGDGVADYVALVGANTGGSGVFTYAVPFMESEGRLVQVGEAELLGDRIQLNGVSVRPDSTYAVDMITQGPGEPLCCGTLRVVREFRVRWTASGMLMRVKNATYALPSIFASKTGFDMYTLSDGRWERLWPREQLTVVALWADRVVVGDLNGDQELDVVAPVSVNYGGSGSFLHLAPFIQKDGRLVQAGVESVGDRTVINSITLKPNGVYVADMIVHGPTDPLCCPSEHVVREYRAAI